MCYLTFSSHLASLLTKKHQHIYCKVVGMCCTNRGKNKNERAQEETYTAVSSKDYVH